MLITSKDEAGESDSDRAAHKKSHRCADASETQALAKNECSANESDARDNVHCAGVMRRVLSHKRTKLGGGPQWFKDDGLEMRGVIVCHLMRTSDQTDSP